MDENRVIGRDGRVPWRLPADLKYFKTVTMGKPLLMGRKTQESIGKPLPGRTNVVITKDPNYQAPGCLVVHSIDEALSHVVDNPEIMVIGGASLYEEFLPKAKWIYLTEVHAEIPGDTYFPVIDPEQWREVHRGDYPSDDHNPYAYSFVVLERAV